MSSSLRAADAALRGDLDLDIGGEERDAFGGAIDQHVRQDRQGVAALDDAADCCKRCEELVSLCFNHSSIYLNSSS
jgi:hypothetical protein